MTGEEDVPGDEAVAGVGPDPVPFAGLRRHARALAAGFVLVVGIIVLVPDRSVTTNAGEAPVLLVRGRILELLASTEPGRPDARIEVVRGVAGGPAAGDVIDGVIQGSGGAGDRPDLAVGDEVIVQVSSDPDAPFVAVSDRYRVPLLAWLVGLFALAVVAVGGWRGVRSLIALALTLVVVIRLVVPLILAGWDPAWVAIVTASGVTLATFLLTEGFRRTTLAAVLGTALSLTLVAVLASVFDALAAFSPLRGSESAGFLASLGGPALDLGGLMLASVIFGALGVLDDVTVTQ
ncbi:MAG TPA: YibE/F family protein, partial [Candidatus Limnocylindrales bacterium]